MTDPAPPFDAEAVIDAIAPLLGLRIDPGCRPGIVTNLNVVARFAALLLEGEIDDDVEQAPVFAA